MWFWRITRRNRVDYTYYALNRDGTNELTIDIPEPGGGTIPVGTKVKTDFDMTILRGSYAWSFFKNKYFDLGIAAGLYGLAVDFSIKRDGSGGSGSDNFLSEIDLTNGGVLAYAKLYF